ncbi:unnamed protein product [Closterium sp. NIES-65]|nr:unnamed protein product [Closterium sp. NIES-65]
MNQRVDFTSSAAAEGGFDSYRDGRDVRRCLNELQTSLSSFIVPAKADISSDAAAAHNEASASLPSLEASGGRLDSLASRSLALSSLQDVLRLDTPLSPRYWPLNRVASLLRSFPELTSLHLPFLSHLGAGPSLGEGTDAGCDYIDAICHIVARCCPSLRHCHIEFGRQVEGDRKSRWHPLQATGTRSQPPDTVPLPSNSRGRIFNAAAEDNQNPTDNIGDSESTGNSQNPESHPDSVHGLMLLLQRCSHLTSLHLLTSNFSPSSSSTSSSSSSPCLHFAPSLDLPPSHNHSLSTIHLPLTIIPLLSRLSHLSLSLKTIPPSLLPSVPSLKSLTLHVSDPACTVTCSSAPFSHLSLLSHLELQMGSDWAKAYPVPRLYENMFSGLQDTLTSLALTLPFMAHLPLSIWELSALRSLSIRNPAFQPGVQRHAYEAGVSGLRHLSCLQLLGHPVPGLMMAALGGTHPETTGRDGVDQQQHQPQEEQLGIGGNEQQQQQRGGQGGEEASRTQQLEQLRMSRGTVAMLNAHQLVGPAAHRAAPATPATPATPAAPAAPAALAANAASTAPFAPPAGEGAGEGADCGTGVPGVVLLLGMTAAPASFLT